MKNPETTISEQTVFAGKLMNFVVRQVKLPEGVTATREIISKKDAVIIVPITAKNEVRLIKLYRSPPQKWLIELPAGGLEPGETPEQAAARELLEETGDRAGHLVKLHGLYSTPGIVTEFLHLYLATDLTPGPNQPEFDEYLEIMTVPWTEAIEMVRSFEIEDGKTIAGLMSAGLYLGLL